MSFSSAADCQVLTEDCQVSVQYSLHHRAGERRALGETQHDVGELRGGGVPDSRLRSNSFSQQKEMVTNDVLINSKND